MSDDPTQNKPQPKPFDPFEPWRGMRDAYLDAWSRSMIETVNSEAYAKATGAMLDSCLTASAPFKEMLEKTMLRTLEQLSMPSKTDFISLAERFTNLEMRMDDMDAALDELRRTVAKQATAEALREHAGAMEARLAALDAKLERVQELLSKRPNDQRKNGKESANEKDLVREKEHPNKEKELR